MVSCYVAAVVWVGRSNKSNEIGIRICEKDCGEKQGTIKSEQEKLANVKKARVAYQILPSERELYFIKNISCVDLLYHHYINLLCM